MNLKEEISEAMDQLREVEYEVIITYAKIGSNKKPISKPISSSDESEFESESSDDSDSSDEEEAPKKPAAVAKNGPAATTKKAE
ncbi:hypothetical protein Lser_V15G03900 [Lactuca serriola]